MSPLQGSKMQFSGFADWVGDWGSLFFKYGGQLPAFMSCRLCMDIGLWELLEPGFQWGTSPHGPHIHSCVLKD